MFLRIDFSMYIESETSASFEDLDILLGEGVLDAGYYGEVTGGELLSNAPVGKMIMKSDLENEVNFIRFQKEVDK